MPNPRRRRISRLVTVPRKALPVEDTSARQRAADVKREKLDPFAAQSVFPNERVSNSSFSMDNQVFLLIFHHRSCYNIKKYHGGICHG